MIDATLQANLERYPRFVAARSALFWLPVFFLYFSTRLDLPGVLALEAVYYAGVVSLEVPTGYLSDRFGRRPSLVLAMAAFAAGCTWITLSTSFAGLALGQVLLAAGMALASGTDTSLLYDTLVALEQQHQHAAREAEAERVGLLSMAAASVAGGLAGSVHLAAGHAMTAVASCVGLAVAWRFVEPPSTARAPGLVAQARAVRQALRVPTLRWLLGVAVAYLVLVHVPYELYQPWLDHALGERAVGPWRASPAVAGLMAALATALGAFVTRAVPGWIARHGHRLTLLGALGSITAVIAVMGASTHPALLGVVLLRSVPGAILGPTLRHAVHPHLTSSLRATWLSLQSLSGRLAFSVTLGIAAASHPSDDLQGLVTLLRGFAVLGVVGIGLLLLTAPRNTST